MVIVFHLYVKMKTFFMERCDEDGRIPIYVGRKSGKIVGGEIHRVYTLINDLVVKIATKNGKIDLKILLLASSLRSLRRYNSKEESNLQELYDIVEKSNIKLDFNKFLRD